MTDTLASVVKEQPDLSAAPFQVRRLLARCLEKDPKKRLADISVVWELLTDPSAGAAGWSLARLGWTAWAAVALLISTAAFAYLWLRAPSTDELAVQFEINAPAGTQFSSRTTRPRFRPMDGISYLTLVI